MISKHLSNYLPLKILDQLYKSLARSMTYSYTMYPRINFPFYFRHTHTLFGPPPLINFSGIESRLPGIERTSLPIPSQFFHFTHFKACIICSQYHRGIFVPSIIGAFVPSIIGALLPRQFKEKYQLMLGLGLWLRLGPELWFTFPSIIGTFEWFIFRMF